MLDHHQQTHLKFGDKKNTQVFTNTAYIEKFNPNEFGET